MHLKRQEELDISIVMPCLNEAGTVGICVDQAYGFIKSHGLRGEVIVVDNGSRDGSPDRAYMHGAEVLTETRKGYGSAIRRGLKYTRGRVVVIGDCDTTYDFSDLEGFYYRITVSGFDMVIGDRFAIDMEKGAMPLLHKIGVKFLSFCGRRAFHTDVRDFHCGIRSISRSALEKMNFGTVGMEFATEMIARAKEQNLKIDQIPAKLSVCRYKRKSKLRAVRDGLRHLGYIVHGGTR